MTYHSSFDLRTTCLKFGEGSLQIFATGGSERRISIWQIGKEDTRKVETLFEKAKYGSNDYSIDCICFEKAEENLIAGTSSGVVQLWSLKKKSIVKTFRGHKASLTSLVFHPFGDYLASGGKDNNVIIWDIRRKQCLQTYKGHTSSVTHTNFTPDGRWLVSCDSSGVAKLWDLTAGKLLHEFGLHRGAITQLRIHPTEFALAISSEDRKVSFWDIEKFKNTATYNIPISSPWVDNFCFDRDGIALLCCSAKGFQSVSWEPKVHVVDDVDLDCGKVEDMVILENNDGMLTLSHDLRGFRLNRFSLRKMKIWNRIEEKRKTPRSTFLSESQFESSSEEEGEEEGEEEEEKEEEYSSTRRIIEEIEPKKEEEKKSPRFVEGDDYADITIMSTVKMKQIENQIQNIRPQNPVVEEEEESDTDEDLPDLTKPLTPPPPVQEKKTKNNVEKKENTKTPSPTKKKDEEVVFSPPTTFEEDDDFEVKVAVRKDLVTPPHKKQETHDIPLPEVTTEEEEEEEEEEVSTKKKVEKLGEVFCSGDKFLDEMFHFNIKSFLPRQKQESDKELIRSLEKGHLGAYGELNSRLLQVTSFRDKYDPSYEIRESKRSFGDFTEKKNIAKERCESVRRLLGVRDLFAMGIILDYLISVEGRKTITLSLFHELLPVMEKNLSLPRKPFTNSVRQVVWKTTLLLRNLLKSFSGLIMDNCRVNVGTYSRYIEPSREERVEKCRQIREKVLGKINFSFKSIISKEKKISEYCKRDMQEVDMLIGKLR